MVNLKRMAKVALLVTGIGFISISQAALISSGPLTVYDSDQNLTWTKDANIAGKMDWSTAVAWADNLVYANYSDWGCPP